MSLWDPRLCILDTMQVVERHAVGYDVACVNDHPSHVCLTKARLMIRQTR
jgi:hypothetical protein